MSTKKIAVFVITILMLSLLVVVPALAVHDVGLFELDTRAGVDGDQAKKNDPIPPVVGDGNTADDLAVAGDDWENVYLGTSSAFATSFIEDTFANNNIDNGAEPFVFLRTPEVTFFTGGGSKDTNGIQDGPWKYKVEKDQVPDKNDIVNAFAAAYDDPNDGHTIFYFGLDTFSVNGDANAGFWFFRQPVGLNPLAPGENTGTFSGMHSDGDIFVAVAYTQGGTVGAIDVYEWVGDDATGSLVKILEGQDCAIVGPNDDVCGVINKLLPDQTFGEDPVFDYANTLVANNPLDPTSYQYESAAFVEFGLDVSAVLGQDIGCFTSFLAETRSSQSETAQLKDFAFGSFPVCGIAVDKTGDDLSKVGDDVNYTITVTNTGKATLYKQSIIDTVFGDLTDGTNPLITSSDCGASLAPDQSCTINVTYTVQAGDPDPLDNTVTVVYTEFADPASLSFTDSDNHSVNLFQPSIKLTKSSDVSLTKVGHDIVYTVVIENTSSSDTPDLVIESISDTLQGDLTDAANYDSSTCGATIASGASCTIIYTHTVLANDADPLKNTASVATHPTGFTNDIDASDDAEVNLFQPSIKLTKSSDVSLTKVGHDIVYTVVIENTSSSDTPDLVIESISDTLQGDLTDAANYDSSTCGATIASGASCTIVYTHTVLASDADPLKNTASVATHPTGFTNDIDASDDAEVNLFQPAIAVDKSGPMYSKLGDDVDYTITLSNNSSADTPAMSCTATDSLLGTVFGPDATLPLGDTVLNLSRTVQAGDPDPLVNTVTLTCSPDGFTNVYEKSASHSVDLIHPNFTLAKTCDAEPISYLGPANFTVTIENTGDVALIIDADDGIGTFTLDPNTGPQLFPVSIPGPFTPGGTADNTVTASWTLPAVYGLDNMDEKTASDSCDVLQPVFETAYAMGDDPDDNPVCFTDDPYNQGNWGWVNGNGTTSIVPGSYEWDVWAGAAQCDTNNGTLVGTVTVNYDAGTGVVSVTWNIDPLYILGDTHIYASYDPPSTFSPGQWTNEGPFDGSAIYIIVHAVVGIPQ
jgi:uncharacterized repeat protein (TIGR01451 family)